MAFRSWPARQLALLALGTAAITGLSGCTIVPGSTMSRVPSTVFGDTPDEYERANVDIRYIPINATVLSHYSMNKIPEARPYPEGMQEALSAYTYNVGVGDVLTITVWEHPELTIPAGSFRTAAESGNQVKADGTVFFPYVGDTHVAGLTLQEIKQKVRNELRAVIRNPQVDVRVADYQSQKVYVSGAVKQPQILPVTHQPMTLVDAIEQAGGLGEMAAWDRVTLSRDGQVQTVSIRELFQFGNWSKDLILQHGDVVHIPRNDADKIFVLGEVNRPQSILMGREGTSLAEGLASANGINENRADGRGIYVLRNTGVKRNSGGRLVYTATVFHLNAARATGFMFADQFPLQARDVVYVAPAPITRWNRFLSQLLPSIVATDNITDIENAN
ncbi:polysaccharide biosynthesis/export family protein [Spongiibacter nanhainus]|uniref:Polysaccharide biosynthesis/export family protein n=1 Tax=Spongiibacter nanhainus TaxID=2794344 RepID=A0A7T4R382_9GAMM|nr:polysaccharide export protein [Spongiibacter nanhainus]QQD19429.1 polysaccharide biosynthesis/export family protein [Spongiibacter nanhainus]